MATHIIQFPASRENQRRLENRKRIACQMSTRWLQFRPFSYDVPAGVFLHLDIMTQTEQNAKPRRLCDVLISRDELLEAIQRIEPFKTNTES